MRTLHRIPKSVSKLSKRSLSKHEQNLMPIAPLSTNVSTLSKRLVIALRRMRPSQGMMILITLRVMVQMVRRVSLTQKIGRTKKHLDIHAVMIQDKVRTSTYARYILTTPSVFEGATVLDVGCGTGILSLFAARAGAKRVIAVDASDIAEKAEKIVQANDFQNVITVVRGKVEDIKLPDGIEKVDVIISEWMGYALLYESMLDSVLTARTRFLKPGGIMAPSQCKMMLGLCDASEIVKDRMSFWNDVYGKSLSLQAQEFTSNIF